MPDTHEGVPQKLFCLKIAVEPENAVDKDNPTKLWVVRGLALTPTDDASTAFRRVGYLELDHRGLGLYWDTIRTIHGGDVSKPLWPNVDSFGFFNSECLVREAVEVMTRTYVPFQSGVFRNGAPAVAILGSLEWGGWVNIPS